MPKDDELLDRDSLMKLPKEDIVNYVLKVASISVHLKELSITIGNLQTKLEKTEGELAISVNANKLLSERVDQLEGRLNNNSHLGQDSRIVELEKRNLNSQQYL